MKMMEYIKYAWFAIVVSMIHPAAVANAEMVSDDEVHEMEMHWDSVIREKDFDKQKTLIREHKEMMMRYSGREDLRNIHRTSSEEMMEHNMDIINTIDMHNKMMWMLERMH